MLRTSKNCLTPTVYEQFSNIRSLFVRHPNPWNDKKNGRRVWGDKYRRRRKCNDIKIFFRHCWSCLLAFWEFVTMKWMPASTMTMTTNQYWWTYFFLLWKSIFIIPKRKSSSLCFQLNCPVAWIVVLLPSFYCTKYPKRTKVAFSYCDVIRCNASV